MNKNPSRRGLSDLHRGYQVEPGKLYDPFVLGGRIKSLRKDELTLTQEKFAELIGTSQATVSRWEQGRYKPQDDLMLGRVASLAGKSLVEFCFGIVKGERRVAVAGIVGAGTQVFPIDDHPLGEGLDEVAAPEGIGDINVVAVRVRGDSMLPMKDGWLLFYRRDQMGVPDDCLNRLCVVRVAGDGPVLVKELRRGYSKGRYTLASWNASPMEDIELEWAAKVLSIRPS